MPNWKTHLEISKRLNEKYKFNEKDYELFLIGSILPDINNSYVVTNISKKISHDITHFRNKEIPSYILFYEKYKMEIDSHNPLFVGYVTHLFTDYMWNNNFYTSIKKRKLEETDKEKLRIMKQSDFKIYNNKFMDDFIDIKYNSYESILEEIKKISEVDIIKKDIETVCDALKKKLIYEASYQFYTEKELDELLEKTVNEL
ncbi:MAG: hypothetical protein IJX99_10430 [Clostridia bacterium]|nr:hypothetical protein [Clostridia bacterium]MBQ8300241.1 hypothetical protein [Clostridia bacterium]